MRLAILGSSGTWPAPRRPASGYLVERAGTRVVLDLGSGAFAALAGRTDPGNLDAIVISHIHPDHCTDLFPFYHYLAYGPGGKTPIPLYAPEGAVEHLAAFVRASAADHPFYGAFAVNTVGEGDRAAVGALQMAFAATEHPVPTVGVRVEGEGRVLVYTADTGPGGGVPALAVGADLLLAEATYQGESADKPYADHLTAAEAGRLARDAGVRRLMLTHLPPTLDVARSVEEAEASFGRPVQAAVPGMEVRV